MIIGVIKKKTLINSILRVIGVIKKKTLINSILPVISISLFIKFFGY